jgi:hypothetical protein
MSEGTETKPSIFDKSRMMSGIYKLGFDPESGKGFMLPFIVTILVGGFMSAIIWFWL